MTRREWARELAKNLVAFVHEHTDRDGELGYYERQHCVNHIAAHLKAERAHARRVVRTSKTKKDMLRRLK